MQNVITLDKNNYNHGKKLHPLNCGIGRRDLSNSDSIRTRIGLLVA